MPRGLRRSDVCSEGAVVAPEPQGEEQHIDTIRQNSNVAVVPNCGVATTSVWVCEKDVVSRLHVGNKPRV